MNARAAAGAETVLSFHGAAGVVTGSCFRLSHGGRQILIDCGLFQGPKTVKELNYRAPPFDPAGIDAVLLTHAHIDHSGLVPWLARSGFRGSVLATPGTIELASFLLPDSGHIQEMDVARLNRRNERRGRAAVEPIYTESDARRCLRRFRPVPYGVWTDAVPGVAARFWNAGHVLGSASIELELGKPGGEPIRLLFSGDVGPGGKAFHPDADGPAGCDYAVLESTYGNRERAPLSAEDRREALRREVAEALRAGGNLLVPVFAFERTQELLYDLDLLFDGGALPRVEVFLDSPLAGAITGVFDRHLPDINEAGTPHPFRRPNLHLVRDEAESRRLARVRGAVILAASGMCNAGRVRDHLLNLLWRPDSTVLLVGYQAPGTLGRLLQDGAGRVRIRGEEVAVRARIRTLDAYSGHADRRALADWIGRRAPVRRGVFLVHGEEDARAGLRDDLIAAGIPVDRIHRPWIDDAYRLDGEQAVRVLQGKARLPPEAATEDDWHNHYARTLIAIGETLRALPGDEAREDFLAALDARVAAAAGERADRGAKREAPPCPAAS